QPPHERAAFLAERPHDLPDRPRVVVRVAGLPVRHVPGAEDLRARAEVLEAARVKLVQVEKVAGVLLGRPPIPVAPGQDLAGDVPDLVLHPRRRAPQALHHAREEAHGHGELEFPIHPPRHVHLRSPGPAPTPLNPPGAVAPPGPAVNPRSFRYFSSPTSWSFQ